MSYNQQQYQLPVKYEPQDAVLARLGFADEQSKAFVYAQAAIMQVDQSLLDIPENIAQLVKAARYTSELGLQPSIHLHIMGPFSTKIKRKVEQRDGTFKEIEVTEKRLALVVGEQAYKTCAHKQAAAVGDYIDWQYELLSRAELELYVLANYPKGFVLTDDDRLARARMISFKAAEMAKIMGEKYDPEWSYAGVFFAGMPSHDRDGKVYYPRSDKDKVPAHRTAGDKAVQRAIKKATMIRYGLVPLDNLTSQERIAAVLRRAQPDKPVFDMPKDDDREDDGDVLFYGKASHKRSAAHVVELIDDDLSDDVIDAQFTVAVKSDPLW